MIKAIAILTGSALLAGLLVAIPSMATTVQANMYAIKGDRLDVHTYGTACSQRGWPYFETSCLRNTNSPTRQARVVRMVGTDHLVDAQ